MVYLFGSSERLLAASWVSSTKKETETVDEYHTLQHARRAPAPDAQDGSRHPRFPVLCWCRTRHVCGVDDADVRGSVKRLAADHPVPETGRQGQRCDGSTRRHLAVD